MTLESAVKKAAGKIIKTDGRGYWSSVAANVRIERVDIERRLFDPGLGLKSETYLRVYWDPKTWNFDKHGLIYTDRTWLRDFRGLLRRAGYQNAGHINYTEQGMQGVRYVHLIVGKW